MKLNVLVIVFCLLCCLSCTKEDDELNNEEYTGIVMGADGCNGPGGLFYKINISNSDVLDFIRTNTLADSLQQEGVNIAFKINKNESAETFCNSFIGPPFNFYDVYDVSLIPEER